MSSNQRDFFNHHASGGQNSNKNLPISQPNSNIISVQPSNKTNVYETEADNKVLISGSSDYTILANLKEAILELKTQYFQSNSGLSIKGPERDQLAQRFLHIEHEVDGLLRRKINLATRDQINGQRNLDFACVLTEKQNTIIQLKKENENLREILVLNDKEKDMYESQIRQLFRKLQKAQGIKANIIAYIKDLDLDQRCDRGVSYVEKATTTNVPNVTTLPANYSPTPLPSNIGTISNYTFQTRKS